MGEVKATEEEGLDLEFCEWQHTHISNHSVFLGVSWFRETEKTCTTMTPNTGALIWRWFLVAWGDIIKDIDPDFHIFLYPEYRDGLVERRKRMFQKVGFEVVNQNNRMVLKR